MRTTENYGPLLLNSTEGAESSSSEKIEQFTPKDVKQVVSWVNQKYQEMRNARIFTERQWYLNLSFYFGMQNVTYRSNPGNVFGSQGMLYVPNAPPWRARPIINKIRPIVRREMAKLNSNKPTAFVMPASNEDRDIFAAQAGEEIWDNVYRQHNLRYIFRRATFWSTVCGNGYIKTYWNPSAFDPISQKMGNFEFMPETPFHVYVPDLREENIENQPYLMHAQMRSLDYVKMYFNPDRKKLLETPTPDDGDEILHDSWLNMTGTPKIEPQVLCLEVWIKPGVNSRFPQGGMFIVCGNSIAPGGSFGWPYKHGMYPFAKIDNMPSGKYYTDSVIVDLIGPQRELNRTRGQIIESKNRMSKPQLSAERGSIDPKKITSEPGQVILYEPGYQPPQPIPLQNLPPYVLDLNERISQDMDEISGQHEVSRGQAPSGVTAATAISFLQEKDDSILSAVFDSYEESVEKVAKSTLALANQYWDEERLVKIVGNDGTFDVKAFKGSELGNSTDIRIEAGSSLPSSKAANQAFLLDLMTMGAIDNNDGLELMELGSLNKLYDKVKLDVRQAQRENLRLAAVTEDDLSMYNEQQTQTFQENPDEMFEPQKPSEDPMAPPRTPMNPVPIIPVNTWDNHATHVKVHNDYRKSQSFESADNHVKALFEEHVNMHLAYMMPPMMGDEMGDPMGDPMGAPVSGVEEEMPGPEPMPGPLEGGM